MGKVTRRYFARYGQLLFLGGTSAAVLSMAANASTTSHAMTTAGVAQNASGGYSCRTAGSDPIIANAFTSGIALPTEGYAFCNLPAA